jgi:hypothetical protein
VLCRGALSATLYDYINKRKDDLSKMQKRNAAFVERLTSAALLFLV